MTKCESAWWFSIALFFALAATSPALADEVCVAPQVERRIGCEGSKLDLKPKRTRVAFKPGAADAAPKQKTLAPIDPGAVTRNTPRIDRARTKKSRKLLLHEIKSVTELYRATPKDSKDRPLLLRRLADDFAELESDLFGEQAETERLAAEVRRADPPRARRLVEKAKKLAAQVAEARQGAITHYRRLADKHPSFCLAPDAKKVEDRSCTDQVLYYLAYEHELAKQHDKARAVYLSLVDGWPQSKYVPHAYLAFGELYFTEAQGDPSRWPLAQQAYEKVAAFPAPANPLWGYAHYKLAYVHWNQSQHGAALDHFKKVIAFGTQHQSLPNATGLAAAARRDLVPVYAMIGKAEQAFGFFSPLSGDVGTSTAKTVAMLEDLGQALMDTGHYAQAKVVYADLQQRNGGASSCSYQVMITKATMALETGNKPPVFAAFEDLLAQYLNNRDGGYPARAALGCANHTAALLAETAMAWHLEVVGSGGVRGTGDPSTLARAEKLYAMVDDNFTEEQFAKFRFPNLVKEDWPTLASLRYHQADILWERKAWRDCGRAFQRAFAADPASPRAADALFASGMCWQNAVLQAKGKEGYRARRGASANETLGPQPLEGDQREMIAAFDRYACSIEAPKNDDDALEKHCEVKYARARAYYDAKHFDAAALAFRALALEHPSCEASPFAANLYLESLEVMRNKWGRAACLDTMSTDVPALAALYCKSDAQRTENAEQCAVLARVERDIARLDIERLVVSAQKGAPGAAKKLSDAGDRYWKLWVDHGQRACAAVADAATLATGCQGYDEVLHNAAAAYDAAHLLAKAMSVRKVLVSTKYQLAATPLAKRALYDLGQNHQAIAVYDQAAAYFERFARESPKAAKAPTALSDAVVLRLGLGEGELALANAKLFERVYGANKPREAAQIAFAIGAWHANKGDWAAADKTLGGALPQIESHATADVRVQTYVLLGRVNARLGKTQKADAHYGKARAAGAELAAAKKALDTLDEPRPLRERRYGTLVSAVGEALHHFALLKRRQADALLFPKYTGAGTVADVNRFVETKVVPWLKKKKPAIEEATAAYMQIIELNDANPPPRWAIAAGAAVGDMWGSLVDDFMHAPYPKPWDREGYVPGVEPPLLWAELKAIYQTELRNVVEPYLSFAKNAYLECLEYGLVHQHFNDEVRTCERWLSKNFPAEFQILDELTTSPNRVSLLQRPNPLRMDGAPQRLRPATTPNKEPSRETPRLEQPSIEPRRGPKPG